MIFTWFRQRRRRELLAQPIAAEWLEILQRNVYHYHQLPAKLQEDLIRRLRIFISEKHWEGGGGFEVTDEMKVTIAGTACILLLGAEPDYCFDSLVTVIVHPGAYLHPTNRTQGHFVVEEDVAISGESWKGGPIVLSWNDVLEGAENHRDGHNVVLHEFAHFLDALDGEASGTPPMRSREAELRWQKVIDVEYDALFEASQMGRPTLLDHYGATNKAEFFAVATECFFERSIAMQRRLPDLYGILQEFYELDPAAWDQS